jgi:DNA (cytosine-5)-methyltransferase 1
MLMQEGKVISKKQAEVLDFIKKYKSIEGDYPTLSQIGEHLNRRSISTIHEHIKSLLKSGLLISSYNQSGYELPSESLDNHSYVPLLGTITAGAPIEAVEESTPQYIQTSKLPESGDFYALSVKGNSMIDEGIYDGDTVVLKRQTDAYDGQSVVAVVDNNYATLKKIYKEKSRFRLQPANQAMLPIYSNSVEIRGVVWEVRRKSELSNGGARRNDRQNIKRYKTLDLFAGIGGIRRGFEKAGFNTVFANDFEKQCKETYDLNFNDSKLVIEDITKIKAEELPTFDFLLGGFPCQAFSVAGYRKGFEDEKGRGNLFFDIARILKVHNPRGFLLENVKNLKTHDGGNTFKVIKETLEALGYHIKYKVLNTMEYGDLPQNRERIYIVGFKDKKTADKFKFPDKKPLTTKITDLLDSDVHEKYYYEGKPLYDKLKNDVDEVGQVYQWRRQYVRKNKRGVCPTLTANMGMGGHNVPIIFDGKGIRKLTPRECFRIQGFDDDFRLPTTIADSRLYKQVGNSVSVPVIERIAINIAFAVG